MGLLLLSILNRWLQLGTGKYGQDDIINVGDPFRAIPSVPYHIHRQNLQLTAIDSTRSSQALAKRGN